MLDWARALQAFSCESFLDFLEHCSFETCILGSFAALIKIVTYKKKKCISATNKVRKFRPDSPIVD